MNNLAGKRKVLAFSDGSILQENEVVVADLENGYTRIANELLDYIGMADITARQYRVLSSVIRYTYGFQKKTAWITAEKVKNAINYSGNYTHISSDLRELKNRKILIQDGKKIGVNTNLSSWGLAKTKKPKTVTSTNEKVCDQNQSHMEPKTVTKKPEKIGLSLDYTKAFICKLKLH